MLHTFHALLFLRAHMFFCPPFSQGQDPAAEAKRRTLNMQVGTGHVCPKLTIGMLTQGWHCDSLVENHPGLNVFKFLSIP